MGEAGVVTQAVNELINADCRKFNRSIRTEFVAPRETVVREYFLRI